MKGKVGIGLRRDIAGEILDNVRLTPDFLEFAPENWMGMGGYWNRIRKEAVRKYPITCHGLSLSLGSPEELDWDFIKELKLFLDENQEGCRGSCCGPNQEGTGLPGKATGH
jgi:hypothetical protein